jgi:hypothetical protein
MLIVLIVIVTFGDLMHFVAVKFDTGLICTGENDLAVTDFCTSFFRSYLRMWTVLLGGRPTIKAGYCVCKCMCM